MEEKRVKKNVSVRKTAGSVKKLQLTKKTIVRRAQKSLPVSVRPTSSRPDFSLEKLLSFIPRIEARRLPLFVLRLGNFLAQRARRSAVLALGLIALSVVPMAWSWAVADQNESAPLEYINWTFAPEKTVAYRYDPSRIQIVDGVAILKAIPREEMPRPEEPVANGEAPLLVPTSMTDEPDEQPGAGENTPSSTNETTTPSTPAPPFSEESDVTTTAKRTPWWRSLVGRVIAAEDESIVSPCYAEIEALEPQTLPARTELAAFEAITVTGGGRVDFQLSRDGGATWRAFSDDEWVASSTLFSSAETINRHLDKFGSAETILFRARLMSACEEPVGLVRVSVGYAKERIPEKSVSAPALEVAISTSSFEVVKANHSAERSAEEGQYLTVDRFPLAYLEGASTTWAVFPWHEVVAGHTSTTSWLHLGGASRDGLATVQLIVPRRRADAGVRVCPGAQNANEVYRGCPNEHILTLEEPTSSPYYLTALEDLDRWHIEAPAAVFSTGAEPIIDALVAEWAMDDSDVCRIVDTFGRATGTISGSCSLAPGRIEGKFGTARLASSTSSPFVIPFVAPAATTSWTFSTWVYPATSTALRVLAEQADQFRWFADPDNRLLFDYRDSTTGQWQRLTPSNALLNSSWQQVAVSAGEEGVALYQNGTQVAFASSTAQFLSASFFLGAAATSSEAGWVGGIDTFRWYNYPFTLERAAEEYVRGSNHAPELRLDAPVFNAASGTVSFPYTLFDYDADVVRLPRVEYSATGAFIGEERPATPAVADSAHSGTVNLPARRDGVRGTFVWDLRTDVGDAVHEDMAMRIVPADSFGEGSATSTHTGRLAVWSVDGEPVVGGSHRCTPQTPRCSTLGQALSQARDYDTVRVATGTYPEQITIERPLSFIGQGNPRIDTVKLVKNGRVVRSRGVVAERIQLDKASGDVRIADALLIAAPGAEIVLSAGTYKEDTQLAIRQSVSIKGTSQSSTVIVSPRTIGTQFADLSLIDIAGTNDMATRTINVSVEDLTVDVERMPRLKFGIMVRGGAYAHLKRVTVKGTLPAWGDWNTGNIIVGWKDFGYAGEALIEDSYTTDFHSFGVAAYGPRNKVTLKRTTIQGTPSMSVCNGAVGVIVQSDAVADIAATTIRGLMRNPVTSTCPAPVYGSGLELYWAGKVRIEGSRFESGEYGIGSYNQWGPNQPLSIVGTTFHNLDVAIQLGGSIGFDDFRLNSFTSTTLAIRNTMSTPVVASASWWGDASGPYDPKPLPGIPDYNNPSGKGAAVTSYIDYRNWLTSVPFQISVSSTGGGSVTPGGIFEAAYRGMIDFALMPDSDYDIDDLVVNGVSVGPTTSYRIGEVTSSYTIFAAFKQRPPRPIGGTDPTPQPIVFVPAPPSAPVSVASATLPSVSSTPGVSSSLPDLISDARSGVPDYQFPASYTYLQDNTHLQTGVLNSSSPILAISIASSAKPSVVGANVRAFLAPRSQPVSPSTTAPLSATPSLLPQTEITSVTPAALNDRLVITGTGLPHGEALVFIHSEEAVTYRVTVDKTGAWSLVHDQAVVALEPGDHTVYAVSYDPKTNISLAPSRVHGFVIEQKWFSYLMRYVDVPTTLMTFGILLLIAVGLSTRLRIEYGIVLPRSQS